MCSFLDDRPDACEGCKRADYPSEFGSSARQIRWNDILGMWLCVECQHNWSNWATEKNARKPAFVVEREKEYEKSIEGIS